MFGCGDRRNADATCSATTLRRRDEWLAAGWRSSYACWCWLPTAEAERRLDADTIIDALVRTGPLKAGLDRESAVDILWALTSPDNFQRLVRSRNWSLQRYEAWLAQIFLDQLLPPDHRQTHNPQGTKPPGKEAP